LSRRFKVFSLAVVLFSSFASVGCGDGTDPDLDPLDESLQALLTNAGVTPLVPSSEPPPALVELGRVLFFDKLLSGNRNISCATCHHPMVFTGDGLPVSIGEGGTGIGAAREMGSAALIPRNAPAIFNGGVSDATHMFWDGRVQVDPATGMQTPEPCLNGPTPTCPELAAQLGSALEAQAMFPVTSPEEMRGQPGSNPIADLDTNLEIWQALTRRIVGDPGDPSSGLAEYRTRFNSAFPDLDVPAAVNFGHVARAIAAFEAEAWRATDTPFDRYLAGDLSALSTDEKRGAILFLGEAGCSQCHRGPLLTDQEAHAVAVPQVGPGKGMADEDLGLALITGNPADNYRFRTPALRNVALTGPWMHDGAFTSLRAVLGHMLNPEASMLAYDGTELPAPFRDLVDLDTGRNMARIAALDPMVVPLTLSEVQIAQLLAFLNALTDPASLNLLGDIPTEVPSGLPVGH
jgi:cytochrome c peroxidase